MIQSNGWFGDAPARAARVAVVVGALLSMRRTEADASVVGPVARLTLRNSNGQVGCMLFGSAKGFPKDPAAALQRKWCAITKAEAVCPFDAVPAGRYAIACFHDENGNGKLDTGLFGIPAEGTVASNHAKGFMGPPSFQDAQFSFAGAPLELRLRVSY